MKMKRVTVLVLAITMIMSFTMTASAAVTTSGQLISQLRNGITIGEKIVYVPDSYISEFENWSKRSELSSSQISAIWSQAKAAAVYIVDNDIDVNNLKKDEKKNLFSYVKNAANIANVTIETSSDGKTITVYDADGNIISSGIGISHVTVEAVNTKSEGNLTTTDENSIKKTGFNMEVTAAVLGFLVVTLVSSAVVARMREIEA